MIQFQLSLQFLPMRSIHFLLLVESFSSANVLNHNKANDGIMQPGVIVSQLCFHMSLPEAKQSSATITKKSHIHQTSQTFLRRKTPVIISYHPVSIHANTPWLYHTNKSTPPTEEFPPSSKSQLVSSEVQRNLNTIISDGVTDEMVRGSDYKRK